MTVVDGSSDTQDINDLGTSYGTVNACGTRTFSIEDTSGNPVSWMSIAHHSGNVYRITASPSSTASELVGPHNLKLRVVSDSYSSDQPAITVAFTVTVNDPCADVAYANL